MFDQIDRAWTDEIEEQSAASILLCYDGFGLVANQEICLLDQASRIRLGII